MYRRTLILVAGLALAPAAASGQDADPQARIEAAIEAAAEAELPTSLLESKVNEGRAKHVPEERIAAAIEARLQGLMRARQAIAAAGIESVTAGELGLAADALEAGVSESALVRVHVEAPAEQRAVATAVLTGLVQLGEASGQALARVRAAMSGGPGELASLRASTVARIRARGQIPPIGLDAAVRMESSSTVRIR